MIYHGYTVTNDGRVFSKSGREMRTHCNGRGYLVLGLRIQGKSVTKSVHRLVAECFIPNPLGLREVDHIDGDRKNNHVSNLRWVTHGENIRHSYALKNRSAAGSDNANSKLTEQQARAIREEFIPRSGVTAKMIGEKYGVSARTVFDIKAGRKWKHLAQGSETSR